MSETVSITLTPFDSDVTFRLQRKAETLGPVAVDHWWMPTPTVYPSAGSRPANYRAIVDAFWQLCRRADSDREAEVAESYLLARLLPGVRPLGSRRVVADARLRRAPGAASDTTETLETLLRSDALDPISGGEFRDQTGNVIGPAEMTHADADRYGHYCDALLAEPRDLLPRDTEAAVGRMQKTWSGWVNGFARRAGRAADKRVLDVLSYEARTALHRCYSAVWHDLLLRDLTPRFQLPPESTKFLRFWHLEQSREGPPGATAYFHLFHGHAFGLHPAGADFIRTPTGRRLLGDWVRSAGRPADPPVDADPAYGRLLRGLLLAVYTYAGYRADANENRRGTGRHTSLD